VSSVGVVAHAGKSIGGGLRELRAALERDGVTDPIWYEVDKTKRAPRLVRQAVDRGADVVFVWGGDGMVQRSLDAMAALPEKTRVPIAIVPAGTANLLASNLGIEPDIDVAVAVGLHGARKALDVGVMNGERFAVMAGTGFDALMMSDVDRGRKSRLGRLAYVVSGVKYLRTPRFEARVKVDGKKWFKGRAACVLVGNVGHLFSGIEVFPDAEPDDGELSLGVVTAHGAVQWARALARAVVGDPARSPFVHTTNGRRIRVDLDRKMPYELDGGDRKKTARLDVGVECHAIQVCVP
jgi:YegS/Rv2252/BmrU family lipid kinase